MPQNKLNHRGKRVNIPTNDLERVGRLYDLPEQMVPIYMKSDAYYAMGRMSCPHCDGTLNTKEMAGFEERQKDDRPYSMVCNKCGHSPYAIDPMTNKILYRDKKFLNY